MKARDWKSIVLAPGAWPRALVVPQRKKVPPGSKPLLASMADGGYWEWELIRGPAGQTYYLRVWLFKVEGGYREDSPAAPLTPKEAYQFALAN